MTGIALLGVAIVLGGLTQFLPWATASAGANAGGVTISATATAYLWTSSEKVSCTGGSACSAMPADAAGSHSQSWFDDPCKDDTSSSCKSDPHDGLTRTRLGGPLLSVALLAAIVGLVLLVMGKNLVGGIVGALGTAIAILMLILFATGLTAGMDGAEAKAANLKFSWSWSFWIAIGAIALMAGGAVVAFLAKGPAAAAGAGKPGTVAWGAKPSGAPARPGSAPARPGPPGAARPGPPGAARPGPPGARVGPPGAPRPGAPRPGQQPPRRP